MKNKNYQWLTVITISIIVATINIFHVIIGLAKTPTGFTYLATGHYYLDYFEYLQHIAAGIAGRWIPTNYFTTGPSLADWRFFPYIILGKIAWIFHFSPVTIYWVAVFFLTLFTLIGFYYLINLMLPKENYFIKIIAFLISFFSGPAYQILIKNGQLILNPYDFWYGPAAFIRRFEVVPYHALGLILLLLIIMIIDKIWKNIHNLSNEAVLIKGFFVAILSIILMTFSPLVLASLMPTLLIVSFIYFIKNKKIRLKLILFNMIILILAIFAGFILRQNVGYGGMSFEVKWIIHDPWWFVLLNLGPIILFFPFGLRDYIKENNFIRQILIIFALISYGLYISPVAYYLGTHNLRFFSSISYVCFGALAALGIKNIASVSVKYQNKLIIITSSLLIIYSCFLTYYSLKIRLLGLDKRTPNSTLTYLPSPIIEGLKSLQNFPQANILTGPYGGIGMVSPIFSYKKVYVGYSTGTPNIEEKQATSNLFFEGKMKENEAMKFLKINKLGFVVLTSLDNYDVRNINNYRFLKPIYFKESIIIWKVI